MWAVLGCGIAEAPPVNRNTNIKMERIRFCVIRYGILFDLVEFDDILKNECHFY